MTLATLIELAQLGTIVVGFLGVLATLRSQRRQIHVQMFIEFSSRFQDVLGSMPVEVWMSDGRQQQALQRSAGLTRSCLQCFHIIANLFQLHRTGYISHELWTPWQRGLRRIMQGAVLRQEWLELEAIFSHHTEFCRYMRAVMSEKPAQRQGASHGRCPHCRQVVVNAGQE